MRVFKLDTWLLWTARKMSCYFLLLTRICSAAVLIIMIHLNIVVALNCMAARLTRMLWNHVKQQLWPHRLPGRVRSLTEPHQSSSDSELVNISRDISEATLQQDKKDFSDSKTICVIVPAPETMGDNASPTHVYVIIAGSTEVATSVLFLDKNETIHRCQ